MTSPRALPTGAYASAKLLVVNATQKQLPLVRLARQRGLRVIVADSRPGQVCYPEADEVWSIAPFEIPELLDASRRAGVAAVTYSTSEYAIPAVWEITQAMGLPSILTRRAYEATCDKLAMRRIFEAAGIQDMPYAEVRSIGDVRRFAAGQGWPVILKPTDRGNQVGALHPGERGGPASASGGAGCGPRWRPLSG